MISTKDIITGDGILISIMEWGGAHSIHGMTHGIIHGITVAGIHHGTMEDGMTHGITDTLDGMVAGADGTTHGITVVGTIHGIMAVITVTMEDTLMDFMMATTVV